MQNENSVPSELVPTEQKLCSQCKIGYKRPQRSGSLTITVLMKINNILHISVAYLKHPLDRETSFLLR